MRLVLPVLFLSAAVFAFAQSARRPTVRFNNPPTLARPTGYSHVVDVTGGRTVYIAGQVALDRSGNVVGKGDLRAQTQQVFENLKAALESAGASFKDVVKINTYIVDMSQVQAMREVRARYFAENPPASTLVQVVRLAREEFLIEIEAIAVVPE